jgi:hypothetical protein
LIGSILLNLVELLLKLSNFDDFVFPSRVGDGESIGIVDDVKNIRLDVLLDDVNFLGLVSELGSSEQLFKSSDVFLDSKVTLGEVFDFFSCSGLEMGVMELFVQFGKESAHVPKSGRSGSARATLRKESLNSRACPDFMY